MKDNVKEIFHELKQSMLTGVSYMLPFVVAGGILIAVAFALGGIYVYDSKGFVADMFFWGKKAFAMMVPILSAYIAYSIADKPALLAGLFGGMLADDIGAGFFGGLIAGICAGYLVKALKKIPIPIVLRSLLPTLIIPVISVLAIGILMQYILGQPCAWLNKTMVTTLGSMSGSSLIILGIIQGCMLAFDLGGPVNKAAYAFAIAAFEAGNYAPMAANFIASMIPPFAVGIAMLIAKKRFTSAERGTTSGCIIGGFAMISEFAIPFAAGSPLLYIPCFMAGGAVGATLSHLFGLTLKAPHGGMFVIFLCNNIPLFLLSLAAGTAVSTALILLFKKAPAEVPEAE